LESEREKLIRDSHDFSLAMSGRKNNLFPALPSKTYSTNTRDRYASVDHAAKANAHTKELNLKNRYFVHKQSYGYESTTPYTQASHLYQSPSRD
jgi:hypothetical protein